MDNRLILKNVDLLNSRNGIHSKSFQGALQPLVVSGGGLVNLAQLKKLAEQYQKKDNLGGIAEEEDDDVPELVEGESFEEASKQETAK